jgi:hypothetical protein
MEVNKLLFVCFSVRLMVPSGEHDWLFGAALYSFCIETLSVCRTPTIDEDIATIINHLLVFRTLFRRYLVSVEYFDRSFLLIYKKKNELKQKV